MPDSRFSLQLNPLIKRLPRLTQRTRQFETVIYLFIIAFIFVASLFAAFSAFRFFQRIAAEQVCPLPAAPTVITTQMTITPDGVDGVINCETLDIIIGSGGEVIIENFVNVDGSSTNDNGGTLLVKNLTIEPGGVLTADGQGYTTVQTEATNGTPADAGGSSGGSGGGHGGAGGEGTTDQVNPASSPGLPYGSAEEPITLGSAGGAAGEGGLGGNGGGALKLLVTENLTINGRISANGSDGEATADGSGGGGAGGSIWIEADTFSGGGVVQANGGGAQSATYQGGGGGGGRLRMFCISDNNFTGTATVNGGETTASQDGGTGSKLGPTCRPNVPTIMKQYRSNNVTEIPVGEATSESTVVFAADMSDIDTGETLALQLEVKPIGTPFSNIPTHTQAYNQANPQPCTSPPSGCGKITVTGMARSTEYHWQVRVRDSKGGFSNWASFGENAETERDVLVAGLAANIELVSGNSQSGIVFTEITDPLVVRITDSAGFPVPGYNVSWSIPQGQNGGTFTTGSTTTDQDGLTSRSYSLGRIAGTNRVRASGSGLSGSPVEFTFTASPDVVDHFTVTAPQIALVSTAMDTVTITAYDQYNNIKTDYDASPALDAVDPADTQVVVSGTLTPSSVTFTPSDGGVKQLSNLSYDTEESIKIRVLDGLADGYSNTVAVVTSLGSCPDPDGLVDISQTWTADYSNQGIFDCRGLDVHITNSAALTLRPYENGDTNYTNDVSVTVLADNFIVDSGSTIHANSIGYRADRGPGYYSNGSGGSYGGRGLSAPITEIYGSVYEPDSLGSGGGEYAGGGAIKLVAEGGYANINGSVATYGAGGSGDAGSGGAIWIISDVIGGSGSIIANGGSTSGPHRPGGGGRIAIYYSQNGDAGSGIDPFDLNPANSHIVAAGGRGNYGNWWGGPGTTYIEQVGVDTPQQGSLFVDQQNNSSGYQAGLVEGDYQFKQITLTRQGHLMVLGNASTLTIADSTDLSGDSTAPNLLLYGTFIAPDNVEINGATVDILGELNIGADTTTSTVTIGNNSNGALRLRASTWAHNENYQYEFDTVNIGPSGRLDLISYQNGDTNYTNDWGLELTANDITIDAGGGISANGFGYPANRGPGYTGAGGSYGGAGVSSSITSTYGNIYEPTDLGSGGSGYGAGGAIKLITKNGSETGKLEVNGYISSNGSGGGSNAGSGGSIWVDTDILGGTGSISANGGSTSGPHRPGGGGRIAVYYSQNGDAGSGLDEFDFTPTSNRLVAVGGRGNYGSWWGGPGTKYVEQNGVHQPREGMLYVDQQNNSSGYHAGLPEGDYQFEKIELTRAGLLSQLGTTSVLTLSNSDSLVGDSTAPDLLIYGTLVAPQTFTVNGVEVDINGEIVLGGDTSTANLVLGDSLVGGIKLRANTWAHNQFNQYQFDSIHVASAGRLTLYSYQNGDTNYTNDWGLTLNANDLQVDSGGRIIADGLGYPASRGPGYTSGQGASHGGQGFGGPTSAINGNVYRPDSLGSGSALSGGGSIILNITNGSETGLLVNNGSISSYGSGGSSHAGSGGSIWINADTIGGNGSVIVNGGSTSGPRRPGSGGRIAIYYKNNGDAGSGLSALNFDPSLGNMSAAGGRGNYGGWWGGPGTIYIEQVGVTVPEQGLLYVDQQNNSSGYSAGLPEGDYQFERVQLTRSGLLAVLGESSNLTILDSDGLTGDSSFPNLRIDGTFNAPNSITISGVDVDINGEMNFGNNADADLTIGGAERGGLTLRANTWAHDAETPYELGDLSVSSNGTLTLISYNNGDTNYVNDWGLTLLLKNMYVESGGRVTADGQGYGRDRGPGYASNRGGSYGGQATGSAITTTYGNVYEPTDLGSGGNDYSGGGAIRLVIDDGAGGGDFVNDGSITSYGSGGSGDGGSGGSIYITTHLLGGTGGISAIGGSTSGAQYPGGGGRIALYFSENGDVGRSIPEFNYDPLGGQISTKGGRGNYGGWWGGPGSVYVEQLGVHDAQGGILYIDQQNDSNGYYSGLPEDEYTFSEINLTRAGKLTVVGQGSIVNISDSNGIQGDSSYPDLSIQGTFNGPDPLYINGYDLNVGGVINLGDSTADADIIIGDQLAGGLTLSGNTWANNTGIYEFSDVTVAGNGVITLASYNDGDTDYADDDRGVTLALDGLEIESGGVITASGRGYGADRGPGYATNGPGVHGGYASGGGSPYGDFRFPTQLGSGGGDASGGGAIHLIIDDGNATGTLHNNGTIVANGSSTDGNGRDPGAGGSILIETDIVGGLGTYTAIGGSGGNGGYAGSGGRIALYTNLNGDASNGIDPIDLDTFSRFSTAGGRGQYGNYWGGPGTVYVEIESEYDAGHGDLYISNSSQYSNGGYADSLPSGISDFHNLYIGTNVRIRPTSDIVANQGSILNLSGDFTLAPGAVIDGVGRGYPASDGPGVGQTGLGQSGGAGGAHGGNGGNGENDGGNPSPNGGSAYGNQREPVTLGSGGGSSGAGASGGRGGSAVAIRARTGHVAIDGDILMDGTNGLIASPGGGGGAGGSILIEGETCDINGTLSAEGGDGGDEAFDGGGGGGGRISILTTQGPCDVNGFVSVALGASSGGQVGQVGTYPDVTTIPATPSFREQFKSDSLTTIPVGGRTQEQTVVLKVNISDPGATPSTPSTLQAEFEVVEADEVFTGTSTIAVSPSESQVLGISTGPSQSYSGGAALISEAEITGLIPGESYKWRARVVNVTNGINGSWAEYGNNGSTQADFIVSTVEELTITPSATSVNVGDPITLTVTALDGGATQDPTYTGTVTFSSTSATASLPTNYTFSVSDAGSHDFTDQLIFFEGGVYTVTVLDTINSALTATTVDITVIGPSPTPSPTATTTPSVSPTGSVTPTTSPEETTVVIVEPPVVSCSEDPLQLACQLPVTITNVTVTNDSTTEATICWDTNIETKGFISYGLFDAAIYTNTTQPELEYKVTGHCIQLTDLETETKYIYKITARSSAGKQAIHEGGFATDGEVVTVLPETGECIIQAEPPYSLNAENQILITYNTVQPGACTMSYGQEPENLRFESESNSPTTSHTGVIELNNLLPDLDIYYQINCTVELVSEEATLCEDQGIVPAATFSELIPTTTPEPLSGIDLIAGRYAPIILIALTGLGAATNLFALPRLVLYAIGWIKDRKKYKIWGIVFDGQTRQPIPFASVRVFKGDEFIKEKITDLQGKYGLPSDKGNYKLVVEHPDFGKVERTVVVEEDDGTIAEDIAMNMTSDAKKAEFKRKLRKNLHILNTIIVYSGLAFSIVATLISPVAFNFFVVILYVLQFALLLLLESGNRRNWGYVFNSQSKERLPGAFVRLFSISEERQIDVQMTDEAGRYGFAPDPGEYHLTVDIPGYEFPSAQTKQSMIFRSPKGNAFIRVDASKEPLINRVVAVDPSNAASAKTGKANPFG